MRVRVIGPGAKLRVVAAALLGAAVASACASPPAPVRSSVANLIRVPLVRQATSHTCGVAALMSVWTYYGDDAGNEEQLAEKLGSVGEGTSRNAMAALARDQGYTVEMRTDATIDELRRVLDRGVPVMVALQAWPDGPIDYRDDWEDGHWAVVIGYDDRNIYFMDPSTLGNYTSVPVPEFLERWHDTDIDNTTRLRQLMLVIAKPRPAYDPETILRME